MLIRFAFRFFQKRLTGHHARSNPNIGASCKQFKIDVRLLGNFEHVNTFIVFSNVFGARTIPQHRDFFALKACRCRVFEHARLGNPTARHIVVRIGEINRLFAFFGNRHGRDDHVEFFDVERGNHAVPLLLHQRAFCLHFGTQGTRDINVESTELAIRRHY